MRIRLGIAIAAFALSWLAVSGQASADDITDYSISFIANTNSSPGPLPTSATFAYDTTINQFASFQVVWDGSTFDFTSGANSPTITASLPSGVTPGTGPEETLSLLTSDPNATWEVHGNILGSTTFNFEDVSNLKQIMFIGSIGSPAISNPTTFDETGTFITSEVATPEPSSLLLLGTGLVGLLGLSVLCTQLGVLNRPREL